MEKEELIAKPMSYSTYRKFLKVVKEQKDSDKDEQEKVFDCAEWVAKNVYGIDPDTTEHTAGTLLDLLTRTRDLSERSELEDLKNLKASGTGE